MISTFSKEEQQEIRTMIDGIECLMMELGTSDAVALTALSEKIGHVMLMHCVGVVVYEGANPAETVASSAKLVLEMVATSVSKAVTRFPNAVAALREQDAEHEIKH